MIRYIVNGTLYEHPAPQWRPAGAEDKPLPPRRTTTVHTFEFQGEKLTYANTTAQAPPAESSDVAPRYCPEGRAATATRDLPANHNPYDVAPARRRMTREEYLAAFHADSRFAPAEADDLPAGWSEIEADDEPTTLDQAITNDIDAHEALDALNAEPTRPSIMADWTPSPVDLAAEAEAQRQAIRDALNDDVRIDVIAEEEGYFATAYRGTHRLFSYGPCDDPAEAEALARAELDADTLPDARSA